MPFMSDIESLFNEAATLYGSDLEDFLAGLSNEQRIAVSRRLTSNVEAESPLGSSDPQKHADESATIRPKTSEDSSFQAIPAVRPAYNPKKRIPRSVGRYKILQKIAEGGMGEVYMAEQDTPVKRRVALKLIKSGIDSQQVIARFEAERQALALMEHPNIARVFDAGTTDEGTPYFVMELINGIPLTDYCDKHRLSINERLELFIPVCRAVQHAHMKGIIHRDLKPSNVLVARYDSAAIAKVIDFGLAKATSHRSTLTDKTMFTEFGQIVGTLQYMSPEQAELNQLDVDTRTDIYALGAMLYELLTGSTPLERALQANKILLKALEIIREVEPPLPSTRLSESAEATSGVSLQRRIDSTKLCKLLRRDLDWIVMKALEKDRNRRYETASDLADELRRYIAGEESTVHPPSLTYRIRKIARRHSRTVTTVGAIFLLLIAGLIGTGSMWMRAESESIRATREASAAKLAQRQELKTRQEIEIQRDQIAEAKIAAQKSLARSDLFLAHARWDADRFGDAIKLLQGIPEEHRHIEWFLARDKFRGGAITCTGHTDQVTCTEFSPDGSRIVSGGDDHSIRIFETSSGKQLSVIEQHRDSVTAIRFVNDDQFLTGSKDGSIRIWSLGQAKLIGTLIETDEPIVDVTINRDRSLVSAIVGSKRILVWSLSDNEIVRKFDVDHAIRLVADPSGDRLYAISGALPPGHKMPLGPGKRPELIEIDIKSKAVNSILLSESLIISTVDISPNGDRIAIAGVPVPNDLDFDLGMTSPKKTSIYTVAIKHTDGGEGEFGNYFLDLSSSSKLVARFVGQSDAITAVRFTQDGLGIIAGSNDGTVEYWDFTDDASRRVIAGHTSTINNLAICNDGTTVASCGADMTLQIGRLPRTDFGVPLHLYAMGLARGSRDGRKFAFSDSSSIYLVDLDRESHTQEKISSAVVSLAFHGDLLAAWKNSLVKILDSGGTGKEGMFSVASSVTAVEFSPDGNFVIVGEAKDRVTVWSWPDQEQILSKTNLGGRVNRLAFSRDNRLFAVAGEDKVVRVCRVQSGNETLLLKGHQGSIACLCFSPDGRYIASGGDDHSLYLWDIRTGKKVRGFNGHSGPLTSIVFASDGSRIISTALDQTIRVWERSTGIELLSTPTRRNPMDLKVSEAGDQLVWTEFGKFDLGWLGSSPIEVVVGWAFEGAVNTDGHEASVKSRQALQHAKLKMDWMWHMEVMEKWPFPLDSPQPPYALAVHIAHLVEAMLGDSKRAQLVRQYQNLFPEFLIDPLADEEFRSEIIKDFEEAIKQLPRDQIGMLPPIVNRAMELVGIETSPPTENAADRLKAWDLAQPNED